MKPQEWNLIRIYVERDGIRAIANPAFRFSWEVLQKLLNHAEPNGDDSQRSFPIPCAYVQGHEDAKGNFILVWEPVLEAIAT